MVLAYHRIAEPLTDPLGLCVRPRHFEEHLEVLRRYGRPVRLDRMLPTLERGDGAKEVVCVTFDDGYADNLYVAKPLLQKLDVPATFFITSGQASAQSEFWWDELGRLLLDARRLPSVPLPPEFEGGGAGSGAKAGDRADRAALFETAHRHLYGMPTAERASTLERLRGWLNAGKMVRPSHAVLTHDEIQRLAEGPLVEIGAHTVTHPVLDLLGEAAQRQEIATSRIQLQELIGLPVTSFAYPHGRYTSRTAALVAEAGFERACTVEAGAAWRQTDRWQLPRLLVRDVDGDSLARYLCTYFARPVNTPRYH